MPNNIQQRLLGRALALLQQSLQATAGRAPYAERYLRRTTFLSILLPTWVIRLPRRGGAIMTIPWTVAPSFLRVSTQVLKTGINPLYPILLSRANWPLSIGR